MDLILLEPGDAEALGFMKDKKEIKAGPSLIDGEAFDKWEAISIGGGEDSFKFNANHCLELVSINQGIKQQVTTDVSNSARTSGRPVITDFTCVKYVDHTSVKFYDYCLRAKPLDSSSSGPTKIHVLRNSGDKIANIMTFSLRYALISEIQFQSHPNDMPTEQFKLNFAEILWSHNVQGVDLSNMGHVASGWSVARNRPIGDFTV